MIEREGYRSDEEFYYAWWCLELKEAGFIKEFYYERDKWELFPRQQIAWKHLRESTYTADFTIEWKVIPSFVQSASDNLKTGFILHHKGVSYVDVKGGGFSGKFNNSDVLFPFIQKFLLFDKWVWVDKFIVSNKKGCGFDKTFTPKAYLLTPTGKEKLLHYSPKTIEAWT